MPGDILIICTEKAAGKRNPKWTWACVERAQEMKMSVIGSRTMSSCETRTFFGRGEWMRAVDREAVNREL